jgi:hypothetical protein
MKTLLLSIVSLALLPILSTDFATAESSVPENYFVEKNIYKARSDFVQIKMEGLDPTPKFIVSDCTIKKVKDMKWPDFKIKPLKTMADEPFFSENEFKNSLKNRMPTITDDQMAVIIDLSKLTLVLKRDTKIQITEIVSDNDVTTYYFIPIDNESKCNGVVKNNLYSFTSEHSPHRFLNEWHNISHGTLIVPFKIREHNWTLTGDATIGYYVGLNFVLPLWDLHIIPLASFGLSTVTVPVSDESTEDKTGITGAGGVVIKHGKSFQIGIIAGVDHLGGQEGKDFEYEDNLWISVMIGFDFAQ